MANNNILGVKEIRNLNAFDGNNFMRQKVEIHFYLVDIGVSHLLDEEKLEAVRMRQLHKQSKGRNASRLITHAKGILLDGLSYDLFDVYQQPMVKIARELWDALSDKHHTENAKKKKSL